MKDQLESLDVEETTTKKWEKKPLTSEEITNIKASIEFFKDSSVEFQKVLAAVVDWDNMDRDARLANRAKLVEAFGDNETLKNYIRTKFETDAAPILGCVKLSSILNSIKNYYGRTIAYKSRKKVMLSIDGEVYQVEQEYMNEIANKPKEERKALILAHEGTKKLSQEIEEF